MSQTTSGHGRLASADCRDWLLEAAQPDVRLPVAESHVLPGVPNAELAVRRAVQVPALLRPVREPRALGLEEPVPD